MEEYTCLDTIKRVPSERLQTTVLVAKTSSIDCAMIGCGSSYAGVAVLDLTKEIGEACDEDKFV